MLTRSLIFSLAALAPTLAAPAQAEPTLHLGDAAPSLGGKVSWIKGKQADGFEKGRVYVLDFWATWCGPCVATIPDLNAVANDYRDRGVTVIGVAIWPRKSMEPTDKFVAKQGDKMNYVIAGDIDDRAAKAYMDATEQFGIPTTMVIDRDGRLAWIGHPQMDLRGTLDTVLADGYSVDQVVARQSKIDSGYAMLKDAEALANQDKWDESFAIVDKVIAIDNKEFGYLALIKFQYLLGRLHRPDDAYAYGATIVASTIHEDPVLLENMAKFILTGKGVTDRNYELAHKAASRAAEITKNKKAPVLDTLAQVCFAMGKIADAHAAETRAIALVTDNRVKKDMQARLDQYSAAMKKPG